MTEKLKILEICPFSAGACGVWARVRQESLEFKKLGYRVRVFSSNIEKGTNQIAENKSNIAGIEVIRFKSSNSFSENVKKFNFKKEFKEYNPDIVITHLLHPHSFLALTLCKKKNIPCYLVTHAPFNVKRRFPLNLLTSIYNQIKVKPQLQHFTKIIAITKWEVPYLLKLGVKKEKIVYIPNGIPDEFFNQKKLKESKKVLFLGRISPVKNLEYVLLAAEKFPNIKFTIVGSAEEHYLSKLKGVIKNKKIENISLLEPIYDLKDKIRIIDTHQIFILPSKREAMPQVLLEAMARGKTIIASKTDGSQELISHNENGFIFPIEDKQEFFNLIKMNLIKNPKIKRQAEIESKKYSWGKLIKSYLILFKKEQNTRIK
ncbi:glycosyltransferase family 4 protein [Candidatus Pacearchaeota archaeon]|nr:glycosyltransferase family 4 protein [Candidatus Pacearchaeota archaeon]